MGEVATLSYVHHSSVGRELREEAEQAFTYSHDSQCIVCTSTMELGIDIGDLDATLQLDAPYLRQQQVDEPAYQHYADEI